jgi:hypothetical protein
MGQIISGFASFGRTVKTGDFENKKAEVQLAFTCEDGEYEEIFALASAQAKAKCEEMLGMSKGKTPDDMKDFAGKSLDEQQEVAKAKKAAKTAKAPAKKPAKPPVEEDPVEDDEPEADEAEAEDPTISDAYLVAKISKRAQDTGKNADIKKLVAKWSENGKANGIPQEKRDAFLKTLAKFGKDEPEEDDEY